MAEARGLQKWRFSLNVQPGDIGYYPGRQTICIFYGDTQPFGYVSVFTRIVERLDDLRATGDRLLRAGILPAKLERVNSFYERALSEMEHTTARVLGELRAYVARCWLHEPADITQLRSVSRPPMGNLPCCFYANFNLFWAGENLQVCRQLVKDGVLPVQVVCQTVAGLLERHAARLEKWSMTETVALERMLAQYFKGKGPASSEEFLAVVEHTLIALDRVQSWIDGLLPWNELDARLSLRRPITVI
jgi:Cyclophilin-like